LKNENDSLYLLLNSESENNELSDE